MKSLIIMMHLVLTEAYRNWEISLYLFKMEWHFPAHNFWKNQDSYIFQETLILKLDLKKVILELCL